MAMSDSRDIENINYILSYCKLIEDCIDRFGNSYEIFESDKIYRAAVSLFELQIGEHSIRLSNELKEKYNEIHWADIRNMRNLLAHHYYKHEPQILWDTAIVDVPELRKFCEARLSDIPNP